MRAFAAHLPARVPGRKLGHMRVRVRLYAGLRERAGAEELELEGLPETLDLAGLKRELLLRRPELGPLQHVRGVLGSSYAGEHAPLCEGQLVHLLPPVAGGGVELDELFERGVFELCPLPLDEAAVERVAHPSCGALVSFSGRTRNFSRGREVLRLEYEAFEAMTGPEMARIFADCRQACEADAGERRLRMLCQHRSGVVGPAQSSVLIAVASPHRALAFEACRFLIDQLKQRLPIWKKEVYADGHSWVNDRS